VYISEVPGPGTYGSVFIWVAGVKIAKNLKKKKITALL
jgi:hypothetical protein